MNALQTGMAWLYAHLLKLYPPVFYAQFADEMQTIFQLRLLETPQSSLRVGIRELAALLVGIVQERQRTPSPIPTWWMVGVLALPVVISGVMLFFRPISIFFLPGKTWVMLAAITLVLMLLGWLSGRRWILLALPLLGYMVSLGMRLFFFGSVDAPAYGWPIEVQYGIPYLLVCGLVMSFALSKRVPKEDRSRWMLYVLAGPMIAFAVGVIAALIDNGFAQNLSLGEFYQTYLRYAWITIGALSWVALLALPLAYLYGSKAVLLIIGYLFSEVVGLAATLPTELSQRLGAAFFLILFLIVTPVYILKSQSQTQERRAVTGLLVSAYGGFFLLRALLTGRLLSGEPIPVAFEVSFVLFRLADFGQMLVMLLLALSFFTHFKHPNKIKPAGSVRAANTGADH